MIERDFTIRCGATVETKEGDVTLLLYAVDDNNVLCKFKFKSGERVARLVDDKFPASTEAPCA